MEKYEIKFKKSVTKDFRVIPKKDVKKILDRINALSENPRMEGCVKLTGSNVYRVRQGNYRIIYEIKDKILVVTVIKIGNRAGVYKGN